MLLKWTELGLELVFQRLRLKIELSLWIVVEGLM
jgi:hypothetical protein